MKLNEEISSYFLSDARDYLCRYEILKERSTHIGLRSKLLVELGFALECSLKSLIYLESIEDEKTTYNKILTHNLYKLSNLLNKTSKRKYTEIITTDFTDYIVDIRYMVESQIDFRTEIGTLSEKYYNTLANFIWLDNVSVQITNLICYIENLKPFEFKIKKLEDIDINEEIDKHKIITNLRTKRLQKKNDRLQ